MADINSHDKAATRPQTATVMTQSPLSRIARRTRGQSHGPITRLMSPSDFGRLLKPFVFLDLFDTQGKPFTGFGLHPHSGIATVTYVAEGSVSSVLVPDELQQGELVAFSPSSAGIKFEAQSDTEFVLGSAVPHDGDLVFGSHSVHTSTEALREAEARIAAIQTRLIQQGRL